jgi:hypothetical protein
MTQCANLTPTVRANADRFTSHALPQTVVGTSTNGVNPSQKDSGKRSKSERCLEIKFLRKKSSRTHPALNQGAISIILSHRKEAMLQFQTNRFSNRFSRLSATIFQSKGNSTPPCGQPRRTLICTLTPLILTKTLRDLSMKSIHLFIDEQTP